MTIIPLNFRAADFLYQSVASHSNRLGDSPYFLSICSRVHPDCTANRTWNSAESFNSRQSLAGDFNTKPWKGETGGNRYPLTIKLKLAFQFLETQNYVVVVAVVSEIFADDGDHHYVVLSLKELKGELEFDGERVSVSAGFSLPRLCIEVARQGLSGIEGLGGIPGTVGGAVWMNAGAYGQEIGTVTETVRVGRDGLVKEKSGTEVQGNYCHTSFREGELILGATLRFMPDEP